MGKTKALNKKEDGCYLCGSHEMLELHHCIFGRANRKLADEDGLCVWLCHKHHNTPEGVHYRPQMKQYFQALAQMEYEKTHTHEEFMARYGRNYI